MPRPASPRARAQRVQHIVAGWRTQALHAAVTLGVPDALAGGAQPRASCTTGATLAPGPSCNSALRRRPRQRGC